MNLTKRKHNILKHADALAENRDQWIDKNSYFYQDDYSYMRFLVNEGQRVLELGCGTGQLLNALKPAYGVGVDLSERMVGIAKDKFPHLEFVQGDLEDPGLIASFDGSFDIIVLSDTLGYLDDCEEAFAGLHSLCTPDTRIVIAYYSWNWEPFLKLGEKLGLKMPSVEMNWLSTEDTIGFLKLADFDTVKQEWRQLVPRSLFGLGSFINRFIGTLPIVRRLSLRNYLVARPVRDEVLNQPSTTVLIPCRN